MCRLAGLHAGAGRYLLAHAEEEPSPEALWGFLSQLNRMREDLAFSFFQCLPKNLTKAVC